MKDIFLGVVLVAIGLLFVSLSAFGQLVDKQQAHKDVETKCKYKCIVLSQADSIEYRAGVEAIIDKTSQQSFSLGVLEGQGEAVQEFKGNPKKWCPKTI
jgi:hypothetical protein